MSDKILVTGATGNVGFEVVRLLSEQGYRVKAAMRNHRCRAFVAAIANRSGKVRAGLSSELMR